MITCSLIKFRWCVPQSVASAAVHVSEHPQLHRRRGACGQTLRVRTHLSASRGCVCTSAWHRLWEQLLIASSWCAGVRGQRWRLLKPVNNYFLQITESLEGKMVSRKINWMQQQSYTMTFRLLFCLNLYSMVSSDVMTTSCRNTNVPKNDYN